MLLDPAIAVMNEMNGYQVLETLQRFRGDTKPSEDTAALLCRFQP